MSAPRGYILDSDVLTIVSGSRRNDNVSAWYDTLDETDIRLCVIAIYEQAKNAARQAKKGKKSEAAKIERTLAILKSGFAGRILSLDATSAEEWGRQMGAREKHHMDAAVAAIAKHGGDYVVATGNVDHFKGRGVPLINPFKRPPEPHPAA